MTVWLVVVKEPETYHVCASKHRAMQVIVGILAEEAGISNIDYTGLFDVYLNALKARLGEPLPFTLKINGKENENYRVYEMEVEE